VRRDIDGQRRYVLHLWAQALVRGKNSGPSGPDGPLDEKAAENGPIPAGRFCPHPEDRPTEIGPEPGENHTDGTLAPLGPQESSRSSTLGDEALARMASFLETGVWVEQGDGGEERDDGHPSEVPDAQDPGSDPVLVKNDGPDGPDGPLDEKAAENGSISGLG